MLCKRVLFLSTVVTLLPLTAHAQTPPAAIPTPPPVAAAAAAAAATPAGVTREELPALVKEIIVNDPEIIMMAAQKLREKQAAEAKQKAAEVLAKRKDDLVNDANSPSIGNDKDADITIVEFFDYHCGYCKRMLPELTKTINEDKKVRLVLKEFPILGEDSVMASRMALAVHRIAKDKYFDYHTALMNHQGRYDEKNLLEMAKKLGIKVDKLKAEAAKPEITALLDKNREVAEEIGIRGTPALIVGDQFLPGALSYNELKEILVATRSGTAVGQAAPQPEASAPAAGDSASNEPAAAVPPPPVPAPPPAN